MTMIRNLGLAALLTLANACSDEIKGTNIVKRNSNVGLKVGCSIDNHFARQGTLPFTLVVDTDGDANFDEAFVTKGYVMRLSGIAIYGSNNEIARATTHYVAPGVSEDKQLLTGFPNTKQMTPEYRAALKLACSAEPYPALQ